MNLKQLMWDVRLLRFKLQLFEKISFKMYNQKCVVILFISLLPTGPISTITFHPTKHPVLLSAPGIGVSTLSRPPSSSTTTFQYSNMQRQHQQQQEPGACTPDSNSTEFYYGWPPVKTGSHPVPAAPTTSVSSSNSNSSKSAEKSSKRTSTGRVYCF